MSVIKGKDIIDSTINESKLSTELQGRLVPHAKVVGVNLSTGGATSSATFDGITATATNNGAFFNLEFTSENEYENVLMVRTVNGSSTNQVVTLGSTAVSFPNLTTGANSRVEFLFSIPATNAIYHLDAIANANSDSSIAWNNCSAYVEKM